MMRKTWLIYTLLLLFATQASSQTWTFRAFVDRMPDERIFLASLKGDEQTVVDSAASLKGTFQFTFDEKDQPGVYRVLLGSPQKRDYYGRDTRTFDIIFDREDIELRTDYNNPVKAMTVTKSDENRIYYSFIRARSAYGARFQALLPLLGLYGVNDPFYRPLSDEFVRVQQGLTDTLIVLSREKPGSFISSLISMFPEPVYHPDSSLTITGFMREHYFDLVNMNDPVLLNSPVYTQKIITYLSFFREPSASQSKQQALFMKAIDGIMSEVKYNQEVYDFVLNYLIDGFEQYKMEDVLVYIAGNYLSENCETDNEKLMDERLAAYKRMAPGQEVENIVLPGPGNQPQRLSDLNDDFILLVFWASWCPHCQELMPELKKWYEDEGDLYDLGIYTVSIDTSFVDWEKFLRENHLPGVNVHEPEGWEGKVARQFNIYATPTMFILDKNRKILAKPITFNDFKREIRKLAD
ncbi:MAG TPA: TlpA disulfide reductase family protein [Bacteroidales bacterium]|nr:TlpA disulfide reductase family protein [Bacteroidales bacterium]